MWLFRTTQVLAGSGGRELVLGVYHVLPGYINSDRRMAKLVVTSVVG